MRSHEDLDRSGLRLGDEVLQNTHPIVAAHITTLPDAQQDSDTRYRTACERILAEVFGDRDRWTFDVRLWTGATIAATGATARPAFTLVLERPSSLREMLLPPSELAFGEAFIDGAFSLEGDVEAAAALVDDVQERVSHPASVAHLLTLLLTLPAPPKSSRTLHRKKTVPAVTKHNPRRDAIAVRSHYDVGNDFYKLWLDPLMVYSCAYFAKDGMTLAKAQASKLDHICRKLRLKRGERLLDIGCGWGGLVFYAAAKYGVEAVGITLSAEQASVARERIARAGLSDRCRIKVMDYRELDRVAMFEKIVSVGMVEHVGSSELRSYFDTAFQLLLPGGLFLNHGIVEAEQKQSHALSDRVRRRIWRQGEFIDRYVFPDGELVPIGTMISSAEAAGFELRDAESLREHYARTLRCWVERLHGSWESAIALVGPEIARTWLLYMSASAHAFASGRLNLVQSLLGKRAGDGSLRIPLTRDDIYSASGMDQSIIHADLGLA